MFGIRFIKIQPTLYVLVYKGGKIVNEGAGLSFFYYAPTTSLVAVPVGSSEAPFIFEETTADFQGVTIQGQITYRVSDPKRLSELMNFTLTANAHEYVSEDPEKVSQRVINAVKVMAQSQLQSLSLKEVLRSSDAIVSALRKKLDSSGEISQLGLEILGLHILAIKPTPETSRALEAEAREQLLRQADEAIYRRRNSAVEQERAIKENELNTDIAVENKKRQIREAQMDADFAVQEKQHELEQADIQAKTLLEEKRKGFVALSVENTRAEAEARAHGIATTMKALASTDPRVLQALASVGMKPEQLIAIAFQGLAERADKIGELNISPELLGELLKKGNSD